MNYQLKTDKRRLRGHKKRYIPVMGKFWIAQAISITWVGLSVWLSRPWLSDLSSVVGFPLALFIIMFIAYIPGYLASFTGISLFIDRQPPVDDLYPQIPITILIAARNEQDRIRNTLQYIAEQDYRGRISVILVDNNSTDNTAEVARAASLEYGIDLTCIEEKKLGKCYALNTGLKVIETDYFITVDADTLLHQNAVRNIVARILSSPKDVCAVAGHVLVRNSRANLLAKMQEWDYFIGIASIKRMQGLYQGTLVAQGAFSLYRTDVVREVNGWTDAIGEDIVLTWKFFERGYLVYFEPLSVAFTEVPTEFRHFSRQRSRWARGLFEGMRTAGPWKQPNLFGVFLTGVDLFIPPMDIVYTFAWLPGLVLAFFGKFYIVGPYTILVLPLNFLLTTIMYRYQKNVFEELDLRIRKNKMGFFLYFISYQMFHSPIAVWGYFQEIFRMDRVWK